MPVTLQESDGTPKVGASPQMTAIYEQIEKIERLRGSSVICYLTSIRHGVPARISHDQIRVLFDHLQGLPKCPVEQLDVFLCSNGGDSVVPWRAISLFREFAEKVAVLVPFRAYSAATLLALGADEIVMHPFGELGPIDPSVSNEFNPRTQDGQLLAISVEDVKAYVNFIKSTVGINHEDELIKAIELLGNKVHPLALGNVERFLSQSRMMARKILKTHMKEDSDDHKIDEIVESMASKLYFHGHPINRVEAKDDLGLKVNKDLSPELETAMWDLYLLFEKDLENQALFNPVADLNRDRLGKRSDDGKLPDECELIYKLSLAVIQSRRRRSAFISERRFAGTWGQGKPPEFEEEILGQGWTHQDRSGNAEEDRK